MNTEKFKQKLEEEKAQLEKELSKIAEPDPENPDNWVAKTEDLNIMPTDQTELADVFEEADNREAMELALENRLNKVKTALQKIKDGTYGTCKHGCKIEIKRLEANPSAETCMKHAE